MPEECYECGKMILDVERKIGTLEGEKKVLSLEVVELLGHHFCSEQCAKVYQQRLVAKNFAGKLESMTLQQKRAITDFDKRIYTLYDHKKYIRELATLIRKYEQKGLSPKQKILEIIDKLLKEVIVEFKVFLREELKDAEIESLASKKKKEHIKIIQKIDFQQISDMTKYAQNKAGPQLDKQITEYLAKIKEKIKEEYVDLSLEEHFDKILEDQKRILEQQKKFLIAEYRSLMALKKAVEGPKTVGDVVKKIKGYYNVEQVKIHFIDLQKNYEGVHSTLIGENERVIKPFNKYLKEERNMTKKFEKYKGNAELTYYDIVKDLQTMTRGDEVQQYFNILDKMMQAGQIEILKGELGERAQLIIEKMYPSLNIKDLERYIPVRIKTQRKDFVRLLKSLNRKAISKSMADLARKEKFAYMDTLTNIPNRRYYDEHMQIFIRRADDDMRRIDEIRKTNKGKADAQEKYVFSLISFDIDKFKEFNDFYGHEVGDIVLKEVAHIISDKIKSDRDLLARTGGEEFAIILDNCQKNNAVKRAEAIREIVENATQFVMSQINTGNFHFGEKQKENTIVKKMKANMQGIPEKYLLLKEKIKYNITLSMGVATYPEDLNEILLKMNQKGTNDAAKREAEKKAIEKAADLAMYQAKKEGRNRVVDVASIDIKKILTEEKDEREKQSKVA